jgi:outer membrane protein TolC
MRRWLCAITVLLTSSARADDAPYVPPDFMTAAPALPTGVDVAAAWRLDLAEALQVAMHRNLGIAIERKAVAISALAIRVARGPFEPTLTGAYLHTHSLTPPLNAQQGTVGGLYDYTEDDWSLGIAQRFETGTLLTVNFTNVRAASALGTAVEPLNYSSVLALGVTQPLLRGFSPDLAIPRVDVLRARIASQRERDQLALVAVDIVERTEDAYWDVVEALHSYDLELRSHKRAEDQLALTHRQIDAGVLPPGDVIAAESTLAQRQLQLVKAEEAVQAAWDRLRAVLNLPREQWSRPIVPIDVPRFQPDATSPEDALAVALKNRPELAQLALDLEAQTLSIRKADNDKLPEIDLTLGASLIGEDASYGGAVGQVASANGRAWTVGFNMTWTPIRRATTAAAEIQRVQHQVIAAQREQRVQDVWGQVRDAVRNQRSAARQVFAAAHARELAEKTLELEERKFLSGQTSNFVVAQRQGELAAAQLSELSAVLAHKKAAAALLRATGRLLAERNVELAVR